MSDIQIPLRSLEDVFVLATTSTAGCYPTSKIQKGLVLVCHGRDLSEEGIGFGVPVLKFGEEAIFPGVCSWNVEMDEDSDTIEAEYIMNLMGRMAVGGRRIRCQTFYQAREWLACQYREHPRLRKGILYAAELSRRALFMKDAFEDIPSKGSVKAVYTIGDSSIQIDLDLRKVRGCREVVIMNEQGANNFDSYRDTEGRFLERNAIGSWDEVLADEASFICSKDELSFKLYRAKGARMLRGWELMYNRLAWAGLAYALNTDTESFSYTIELSKI